MLEKNPLLTKLQCQLDKTSVYRPWLSFVELLDQILASRRYADNVYQCFLPNDLKKCPLTIFKVLILIQVLYCRSFVVMG